MYEVQELAAYDPMIPREYFRSLRAATGERAGTSSGSYFGPAVPTPAIARRYGVGFVLEPTGTPGPRGANFVTKIGDEDLYRIPGAAAATLTPTAPNNGLPNVDAVGKPVHVTHSGPASWKIVSTAASPQVLRLRLTDVPGWHATIDGKPLPLHPFSGVMLQALIPRGKHVIQLNYWPMAFTVGLFLAACSFAGLSLSLVVPWIRRRRSDGPAAPNACHGLDGHGYHLSRVPWRRRLKP